MAFIKFREFLGKEGYSIKVDGGVKSDIIGTSICEMAVDCTLINQITRENFDAVIRYNPIEFKIFKKELDFGFERQPEVLESLQKDLSKDWQDFSRQILGEKKYAKTALATIKDLKVRAKRRCDAYCQPLLEQIKKIKSGYSVELARIDELGASVLGNQDEGQGE